MAEEVNFKGIRQLSKDAFDDLSEAEKKCYLNLVRDLADSGETAYIYFGTRLYADKCDKKIDCGDFDS